MPAYMTDNSQSRVSSLDANLGMNVICMKQYFVQFIHFSKSMISVASVLWYAGVALGQNYPSKPIRLVTSDVGSGSDYSARVIAQGISGPLGQQVIVDNRAGGLIAPVTVARAQPDGYTLLFYGTALWLLPLMRKDMPYDMANDYAPVAWATTSPNILVVHPSLPAKSLKDLIAFAKAKPGVINYASGGSGTINHLAAELLKSMAHIDIMRIAYKGQGAALNDLLGGHVQLMFVPAVTAAPHLKSGKLIALAVTSAKPFALLPGLATIAAGPLPGYEAVAITGVFAPAKTPAAIINRLNSEI